VIGDDDVLDYAALDIAADRCAAALLAHRLGKGDRVAVLSGNHPAYAILHFGAARAGVVLVHLSTRATPRELAFMLDRSGARMIFIQPDSAPTLAAARDHGAFLDRVITLHGSIAGVEPFDSFFAAARTDTPTPALGPDDLLAITFTGGTTGMPKGVVVTHRARAFSALSGGELFGLHSEDIGIVATPMFHAVGLFVWFGSLIASGATAVLLARWDPEHFISATERWRANAALCVPTQLADLVRSRSFSADRLASLNNIQFAGAPMSPALLDELERRLPHVAFGEHFGQSETGPVTVRHARDPREKRSTIGRPVIGTETRIVDPSGRECAENVVGEIVTRGPHLLRYYWQDDEQTRQAFRYGDGFLATGDLGRRDAERFITLVDRAKDMIVSGGENIYPIEIENALARHHAVAECAVFGVPDPRWGEVPAAHIVLRTGATASAEDIIAHCESETARWKRPRLVVFVDRLPRNAIGKVLKSELRAPYWRDARGSA
jgi:acyl-CoA synthetase (AMP-forming)/AMP-acid ligase II